MGTNKTIYQISVKNNYLKVEMEIFDEKNDDSHSLFQRSADSRRICVGNAKPCIPH